jgi:chromate reductase, NAD(P)H dehydrogenase (quinone)
MNRFHCDEEKLAKVLGIVGSLRVNSLNGAMMKTMIGMLPDWIEFETFDIGEIPHYNQDVEDSTVPGSVSELRQKIKEADLVLIAAPEYNRSVSGVLKDALDWASRPYGESSFSGKPVAVLTAVSGRNGGRAVQTHLTLIIDYLDARLIGDPVLVQLVSQKFDKQFNISDKETFDKLGNLAEKIVKELSTKIPKVYEVPVTI